MTEGFKSIVMGQNYPYQIWPVCFAFGIALVVSALK
jgi:hypothetical protein